MSKTKRGEETNIPSFATYGKIKKNNGCHFDVLCIDNIHRIGRLTKKAKQKQKYQKDDYVVISIWEFQTARTHCDILGPLYPVPIYIQEIFNKIDSTNNTGDIVFTYGDTEIDFSGPSTADVDFDAI